MMDKPKPEEPTKPKKELDADDILRRVDSFPILDPRSPDEMVGYDENGLPTGLGHASRSNNDYSSSSFTSPRSALAFSMIFSCNCPGTTS